jgi:hypothetical protein
VLPLTCYVFLVTAYTLRGTDLGWNVCDLVFGVKGVGFRI